MEPCCEVCGINKWKNYPFQNIAEIEPMKGNKTKLEIIDFRVLCPNSHTHTRTRFRSIKGCHFSKNESDIQKKKIRLQLKKMF